LPCFSTPKGTRLACIPMRKRPFFTEKTPLAPRRKPYLGRGADFSPMQLSFFKAGELH
jgi:hypothetical protein